MSEDNNQDHFTISGDYSQQLFTDVQNDVSPTSSADDVDGVIENSQEDTDRSQSLLQPQSHNKRKYITEKEVKEEENTHNNNMDDSKSKKKKIEHADDEVNDNQCIHCIFDKELDKRNYYFGNLLIGELQYLPPCMRSEAYINILNYVKSLKHMHKKNI